MTEQPWEARLEVIEQFVADALQQVQDGVAVELRGLDAEVDAVCEQILALPLGETTVARQRLENLVKHLEILSQYMRPQQEAVRRQLESLNVQKKAHLAYKKTDAMPD